MLNPNDYDLSRDEWEHLIDQYIFSERDRKMLKRKMFDDITYERLAEEFELSVQRSKSIIGEAKTRLFRYLN
jgi:DNA-directed RNA polymerase specialized sigma24 family protein